MGSELIYQDGTYLDRNPTWHEEDAPWKAGHIQRMIDKHALTPRTISEIGCGTGGILAALAQTYGTAVQFTGYELSPQALELCQQRTTANLAFFAHDPLAEPEITFDLVLIIDVIEHIEDYFSFLRRARPKGIHKLLHIPLDLSALSVARRGPLLKWREDVGHIHYFTKDTALAALADCGYEVIDHTFTATQIEVANRGWKADLMKLPRRLGRALDVDLTARLLGGFSLLVLAR